MLTKDIVLRGLLYVCCRIGSIDDDLDELLDITKSYGRARPTPTPSSAAVPLSTTVKSATPTTTNASGTKFSLSPLSKGGAKTTTNDMASPPARKVLPPLKKGPPSSRPAEKKDEAWLDSVLGI